MSPAMAEMLYEAVLGVLAHNDEVDGRLGAGHRLDGPHVGVQLQALAQRDDGRRVALGGHAGRRDGAEQSTVAVRLERRDRVLGQRHALLLERVPAGLVVREAELQAERRRERLEDAAAGGDHLAADAVAGDEAWRSISIAGRRGAIGRVRTNSQRAGGHCRDDPTDGTSPQHASSPAPLTVPVLQASRHGHNLRQEPPDVELFLERGLQPCLSHEEARPSTQPHPFCL
ncbi:hypothetical protein OPT61_g10086 [Boeremia exigua]|uniref:Uncharacterized protein n=1 Tax=Boeremia exigua TaxID=749465 RepID=A0ACC2HR93_9PLEO|nr:hypothetical protein OPT61_g10086 [Boeremia exigua]